MSKCEKCGLPLKFIQKLYKGILKWTPVNPDGSDHWDTCKTVQRKAMGLIRSDGSVDMAKLEALSPPRRTGRRVRFIYCGEVPPWDESLGSFRRFTEEEMLAGAVCRRPQRQQGTSAQVKRSGWSSTS